ncbi:Protein mak11 [Saxophila tyrrhenica]|uniref:Protein mak11 n=1 Tax=Saxophila tyrrhenica TaxID=1690608 RepID=A0AAV9NWG4_9PEZI|nr:Protein mak11 [Saxophila tyrrhenica]
MATATLKRPREAVEQDARSRGQGGASQEPAQKKRNVQQNGKRDLDHGLQTETEPQLEKIRKTQVTTALDEDIVVQIVAGSYERVLHGVTARIPTSLLEPNAKPDQPNGTSKDGTKPPVTFSNTFLFAAHTSSLRCLALSPPTENNKRLLATGSSDERINLYSLSTIPPQPKAASAKPSSLLPASTNSVNPLNRPLGSLTHHSRPLTTLSFPSKSKLFSSADDNTVAITRTRDWTLLSTIKAPVPKPLGRPSGDTLAPGEVPAGVNDFAVHPSQKLAISVGRGEKCMRLWNLMTGKKAGVLQFERSLLEQAGEGKWGTGEGRKVLWREDGEAFVVGFERGAVVFGVDSQARAVIRPEPARTKVHQMRFLPGSGVLAISAEDGRVLFYDVDQASAMADGKDLPHLPCLAQLDGREAGVTNRIKDFDVLSLPAIPSLPTPPLLLVTASSDGAIRLWSLYDHAALAAEPTRDGDAASKPKQVGQLLGVLETGNRITCLGAFVMDGKSKVGGEKGGADVDGGEGLEDGGGSEVEQDISASEEDIEDGEEEEFAGLDD